MIRNTNKLITYCELNQYINKNLYGRMDQIAIGYESKEIQETLNQISDFTLKAIDIAMISSKIQNVDIVDIFKITLLNLKDHNIMEMKNNILELTQTVNSLGNLTIGKNGE